MTIQRNFPLRPLMWLDAIGCALSGIAVFLAAAPLATEFALPFGLLQGAGIVLLPCAALLAYAVSRAPIPRPALWAIVAINSLWIAASFALPLTGQVAPNGTGWAFLVGQAALIALFTALYLWALLRGHEAVG